MRYILKIKRSAEKELDKVPLNVYKQLAKRIFSLADNPCPAGSKKLKEKVYRIRSGDYRIIYSVDKLNKVVEIIKVGHRREVYR